HADDVDGVALCGMFNKDISTMAAPKYLNSDNDPLLQYHQWQANLRILSVEEIKTIPYTPRSHPFIERLIGTIRREFLNHTSFWNAVDLERNLDIFEDYYNHSRTHALWMRTHPLKSAMTESRNPLRCTVYAWERHCGGLFQLPVAA
ncbi:MAG: integrase core domain-containing protein, partial [Pseudomonadota bacterium]